MFHAQTTPKLVGDSDISVRLLDPSCARHGTKRPSMSRVCSNRSPSAHSLQRFNRVEPIEQAHIESASTYQFVRKWDKTNTIVLS
jgi:hypothetical protein